MVANRATSPRGAGCVLALALPLAMLSAAGHAQQPAADEGRVVLRVAVTDPARVQAGEFFKLHDKAMAWQFPGEVETALAGNEALLRLWSADRLAQQYLVAADGAESDAITVGVLRSASGGVDPEQARNTINMPDGHQLVLPIARSYAMHLWLMRAAATARAANGEARPLPERMDASVQGDCPFSGGPLVLAHRGFLVEGRRDGRLLLKGAIGGNEAWFIAEEVRYITSVRAGERVVEIRVPDRPSHFYRTALDASTLRLAAAGEGGRCEIVLQPAR